MRNKTPLISDMSVESETSSIIERARNNPYVNEFLARLKIGNFTSNLEEGDSNRLFVEMRHWGTSCSCMSQAPEYVSISFNLSRAWYNYNAFYLSMQTSEAPPKRRYEEDTLLQGLEIMSEMFPRLPAYVNFEHLRDAVSLRWPRLARKIAKWLTDRSRNWTPSENSPQSPPCARMTELRQIHFVGEARRSAGDRFEPCWLTQLDERGVCSNFWSMLKDWNHAEPDLCDANLMAKILRCSETLWEHLEYASFVSEDLNQLMRVVCHVPKYMFEYDGFYSFLTPDEEPNDIFALDFTFWNWNIRKLYRKQPNWPIYHTKATSCSFCSESERNRWQVHDKVPDSDQPLNLAFSKAKLWRRSRLRGMFFAAAQLCVALRRLRWWKPGGKYAIALATRWNSRIAHLALSNPYSMSS